VALAAATASAQTTWYWDNFGGTANDWQSVDNWSLDPSATTPATSLPDASGFAEFNATTRSTVQTVNANGNLSVLGINFVSPAAVTLQGGGVNRTLTLGTGGITKSGTGVVTISSTTANQGVSVILGGVQTWTNNAAGNLNVLNAVNNDGFGLTIDGAGVTTLQGAVTGGGAVVKNGSGVLVFSSTANTFSGGLTVNGGTAAIASAALAAGGTASSFGTGRITVNSGGTVFLNINATNSGTMANSWTLGGGTLRVQDGATVYSGGVTVSSASVIEEFWGDTQTFNGVISGAGGLTFRRVIGGSAETPVFLLNGANTITGTITAGAGAIVRTGTTNALGNTSAGTVVQSGGALDLFGKAIGNENVTIAGTGVSGTYGALVSTTGTASLAGNVTMAGDSSIGGNGTQLTLSGVISGSAALTKVGTGITILSGTGTYTGATTVSDGTLRIAAASALGPNPTVLVTNVDTTASNDNALQLSSGITVGAGKTVTLRNTGTGNFGNARSYLDNISGTNTWAGDVRVEGGSNQGLRSQAGLLRVTGSLTNSGTLPTQGIFIRGNANGEMLGLIALGTASLFKTDPGTWTVSSSGNTHGALGAAHGILVANANNAFDPTSTLTLGQATSSGTFTVNAGFAQEFAAIVVGSSTSATGYTQIINGGGSISTGSTAKTLTVADNAGADDIAISAGIVGTGTFVRDGAGTLVLVSNTISAPLRLDAGTTRGEFTAATVAVNTGATLMPGGLATSGTITTGALAFDAGTQTLAYTLGNGVSDLIAVTGSNGLTTSGGLATFAFTAAGALTSGSTYDLITYVGTSPGLAGFTTTTPGHATGTLVDTGSAIAFTITDAGRVIWTGSTNNVWDVNATPNWKLQSTDASTTFLQGDNVLFNDTGANTSVSLTGTVQPSVLEFDNSTVNYDISGSGVIQGMGPMQLTKLGSGTVTLNGSAPHTYTGATVVSAGELAVNSGTSGASPISATSGVSVASGATLRLFANNQSFTFSRVLTGSGTVLVDPNAGGTAASQNVTLSGSNSGFTGTLVAAPSGDYATNGTMRIQVTSTTALGGASVAVRTGGQMFISSSGTFANAFSLAGYGYQEAAGGVAVASANAANGSALTVPAGAYSGNSGIGALRGDGGATIAGPITLASTAKISPYNATLTIAGDMTATNPATDDLVVGGVNQASTVVLTGNNAGLGRIWLNGGVSGTTAYTQTLAVGTLTGTSGSLGSGDVVLYADTSGTPLLQFQRADGYILPAGQTITSAYQTVTNATKPGIQVNMRGAGLSVGTAGANTIDLLDASGTTGGQLRVGTTASGSGAILTIGSGATVRTRSFYIGDATSTGGNVTQTGGSVVLGGAAADTTYNLRVGHWSTEFSTYTMTGGTITFSQPGPAGTPSGAAETAGGIYVGIDGVGTFSQGGGEIATGFVVLDNRTATTIGTSVYNLASGTLGLKTQWGVIGRNAATSAFNWSGGTIRNLGAATAAAINTPVTLAGNGTLDTVDASNSFVLMNSVSGSGTITVAGGGALVLNPDSNTTRTGTSTGTGTQTIGIGIAGASGLTKIGTGTTTLAGVSTYTGATDVQLGRLNVTGSAASSAFTVSTGAILGGEGTLGDLTFNAGVTLGIDASTSGQLTAGNLAIFGPATVVMETLPTAPGAVNVLAHTGAYFGNPATDFTLAGSADYRQAVFADVSGTITLDTGNKSLAWNGTSSPVWNVNGNVNWATPETDRFYWGDLVTFDDSGVATAVQISGTIQPWGMTVSSTVNNYTIEASDGSLLTGVFGLLKTGPSTLTMSGTTGNSFTGGTVIREGAVRVHNATSLGSGTITLADSAASASLYLDVNRSTVATPIVVSGSGAGAATLGSLWSGSATGDNNQFTSIRLEKSVTLDSNAQDRTDYENISGTGSVTVTGSGRSVFVTTNPFTGDVTVSPSGLGNLQLGVVSGALNAIPDAAVVTVAAVPGSTYGQLRLSASSETIGALAGTGVVDVNGINGTLTVGGSNVSGTFAGSMRDFGANTFALTKGGSGTQVLTGSSSYSGATTVAASGGVLRVESQTALSPNSQVSLAKSGTQTGSLQFATSGTNTFANPFASLPSSNSLANGGTPGIWNVSGVNTLTRNLTINAGGGNGMNIVSDGGLLTLGGTLQNNGGSGTRPYALGGSGNGVVSGAVNNGTISGSNVAAVIKHGGGTWSLTNASNTFTGGVNILDGVLEATGVADTGSNSAIGAGGDIVFAGAGTAGTFRYAGGTDQSTNRPVSINATGATLESAGAGAVTFNGTFTSADPGTFSVNATGSSGIVTNTANATPTVKVGMTVTSTTGLFPVGTTVTAIDGNAYTLSSSATATASGNVTFGTTDRTLTLTGVNTGRNTVAGSLADSAGGGVLGVTKAGLGTWVLSGSNSYTGPTAVNAGTLFVNGINAGSGAVSVASGATLAGTGTVGGATTITTGATLSPGASPGTLSFTGGLTWNSGGNYNWQMLSGTGSAGALDSWDLVSVTGTLAIAATNVDPFRVNLWTLSGIAPDVSGSAATFDSTQNYTWKIASAAGGISGFAADKFVIATSATNGTGGFANALGGGTFSVAQSGNDLNLVFTANSTPTVITINVASGTQTQTQAGYPTLSGSTPVVKTGGGTLVLDQANTLTGSTTVQGGVVQLANASALSTSRLVVVAGGTGQLAPFATTAVAGLDLATGNGLMDVTNGSLTILGGMTAPELVAELLEGRADGSWTGTSGITSSTAAADIASSQPRAVGWLDNGDGTFTVAYAAPGDTNIDWAIDILDASNFLALGKFDTGLPATWIEGDFSYDGIVDILDAADFFATGLYDAGTYNTAPGMGGVAAVPEPAALAGVAVAVAAAVCLRRRR
jgi:autotransporter-associated beta strand protein